MIANTKKVQQSKTDAVNALKGEFESVKDFIFTDYRGMTVEQITDLRKKLKDANANYKVIKNRFAKIAFKQLNYPDPGDNLIGPTAVAIPHEESGPIAKILFEFSKETPVKIKGGFIDNQVFDVIQMETFSRLPSKQELIGKLLRVLNAPVQNVVFVLNGVPQKLVRTLSAVAENKKESN